MNNILNSTTSRFIRNSALAALALVCVTGLTGCESGEDRSLASAQSCLDAARSSSDADQCIAMVEGLTTPESYLIRCSANFIAQGFTGDRIADAFSELQNGGGTNDPMVAMMAYLNFDPALTNHTAAKAVSNCEQSGVISMLRLATAAELATTLAALVPGIPVDPTAPGAADAMQDVLEDLQANPPSAGEAAAIGQVAVNAASAYCGAGSSYATNEVCVNLNASIAAGGGGTNLQQIGLELIDQLLTH